MAKRDSFLLRVDPIVLQALKVWAADELRSLHGQIEFLLRDALVRAGREPRRKTPREGRSAGDPPPGHSPRKS